MEEHPASSIHRASVGPRTRGEAEPAASAGNGPSLCPSEQRAVRRWALILICTLLAAFATAVLVAYVESLVSWVAFGVVSFIFITAGAGVESVAADNAREGRFRRRLRILETWLIVGSLLLISLVGGSDWLEWPAIFIPMLMAVASVSVIEGAFRKLRNHYGLRELPFIEPEPREPEMSSAEVRRYWAEPGRRRLLHLLTALEVLLSGWLCTLLIAMSANGWIALASVSVLLVLIFAAAGRLHRHWGLPPPLTQPPPPPVDDLGPPLLTTTRDTMAAPVDTERVQALQAHAHSPGMRYQPRFRQPTIVLPFVPLVCCPIALAVVIVDSSQLYPGLTTKVAIWTTLASVIGIAVGIAVLLRMLRMRLDIGSEGITVVNFWTTHRFGWDSVTAVQRRRLTTFRVISFIADSLGGALKEPIPISFRFAVGRPVPVTVTAYADDSRNRRYFETKAFLFRDASSRDIPIED